MNVQIAKIIFHSCLEIMKNVLDLIAFKYDKKSDDYKFFKKQIMSYFYDNLRKLFKQLIDLKMIEKCSCNANLRNGYSECPHCGGSGYKNKEN